MLAVMGLVLANQIAELRDHRIVDADEDIPISVQQFLPEMRELAPRLETPE